MRLAMYFQGARGLGHVRRTQRIARILRDAYPGASILLVTGSRFVQPLHLPTGVDYVKLPSVRKDQRNEYSGAIAGYGIEKTMALRRRLLKQTLVFFRPNWLFVDNVPRGVAGELLGVLPELRASAPVARCFLVLRDIMDDPAVFRQAWNRYAVPTFIEDFYDRIFVFGEEEVFDVADSYGFGERLTAITRYCGYLRVDAGPVDPPSTQQDYLLVLLGGGSDGRPVVECLMDSLHLRDPGICIRVVAGPEMPAGDVTALMDRAARLSSRRFEITRYFDDPLPLLAAATAVVSMAGYNTVSEILSLRKRALLVPRRVPTAEQHIRAKLLASAGYVDWLSWADLNPTNMAERVRLMLACDRPRRVWVPGEGSNERLLRELECFEA